MSLWRVESVQGDGYSGYQIMDGDEVLVEMYDGNVYTKPQMRRILSLMAAAPQMQQDIEAFLAHADACTGNSEAAEIVRDMTGLFRDTLKQTKRRIR